MKNRKMKTERESASNFLIMPLFFVQVFNDIYHGFELTYRYLGNTMHFSFFTSFSHLPRKSRHQRFLFPKTKEQKLNCLTVKVKNNFSRCISHFY